MERFFIVMLAAALAGCGPLASDADSGGAGAGSGSGDASSDEGEPEGSGETGLTHPTVCEPAPQEGVSPFDPEDCTTYEDEEPSGEYPVLTLTVRIVNASGQARTLVPLGTLQPARYHELVGSVASLPVIDPAARCPTHFADYHCNASDLEDLCADLVLAHDSITLAPGASFEDTWTPWLVFELLLPTCHGWGDVEVPCAIPRFVVPGDYEIVVRSASTETCPECCVPAPGETCQSGAQPTSGVETTAVLWDGVCETVEVLLN